MTRIQKIKKFVNAHAADITAISMLAGFTALCGVLMYKGIKEQEAINAWIHEQHLAGNVVHQLIDGSLISVKYTQN